MGVRSLTSPKKNHMVKQNRLLRWLMSTDIQWSPAFMNIIHFFLGLMAWPTVWWWESFWGMREICFVMIYIYRVRKTEKVEWITPSDLTPREGPYTKIHVTSCDVVPIILAPALGFFLIFLNSIIIIALLLQNIYALVFNKFTQLVPCF